MSKTSDTVLHSRAGDRFHYLWAARRCLQMIHPLSPVREITIEGAPEPDAAGELVIDVGEVVVEEADSASVRYFQLKHCTVRTHKATTMSELEKTIHGFANRFKTKPQGGKPLFAKRSYWFVSNRPVADSIILPRIMNWKF